MSGICGMQDRQDRRVRRNRAALMAAAVRLVSERGTTALPVADLADAADVSRQLVHLQFGDRDALLVAAATDLVERELIPSSQTSPRRLARAWWRRPGTSHGTGPSTARCSPDPAPSP
jgi:AcrR family transcriptional regulator